MSYTWTDPTAHVYAVGEAVTAGTMNTYVQQNLAVLGQNKAAVVVTGETTTSLTYTDLATVGPAVTINTMTTALITVTAYFGTSVANDGALVSVAVSGATTLAAADANSLGFNPGAATANFEPHFGGQMYITGLTAGANTFTAKYRAVTGGTATFGARILNAEALSA